MKRIFVSSVQREFAEERQGIRDFVHGDPLMRRFFSVFLFEDIPATDRRADQLYLSEVDRCDIYVGLFGNEYGSAGAHSASPTGREFDRASKRNKTRLVFIKGSDDADRDPRMQALITKAGSQLVRRRFSSMPELIGGLYAALVQYLDDLELIRNDPFDAEPCAMATVSDLDAERMTAFLSLARRARAFPLAEEATTTELLTHLNLLNRDRPTQAAVLLFGKHPQRFLISSEVKCAHFHGTEVTKPIPSYQVYKGTVFELVDQAVDFVMSKVNLAVGTRAESTQAPVAYEMPLEVVREAIVNAVAHRDYTSNGSVQVMLFSDRLEVWNPGTLPPSLTLEMLRRPHGSVPGNPLLAESLYLAKYIERMGTGTGDMINRCREAGLPEPQFAVTDGFVITLGRRPERALETVTGQVSEQVDEQVSEQVDEQVERWMARALSACQSGPRQSREIQDATGIHHRYTFQRNYLNELLSIGYLERTIPDKPNSRLQRYRLTRKGRRWLEKRTRAVENSIWKKIR